MYIIHIYIYIISYIYISYIYIIYIYMIYIYIYTYMNDIYISTGKGFAEYMCDAIESAAQHDSVAIHQYPLEIANHLPGVCVSKET